MSTFLCKNGVRKEYFLTPTFIIEPFFTGWAGAKSRKRRVHSEAAASLLKGTQGQGRRLGRKDKGTRKQEGGRMGL